MTKISIAVSIFALALVSISCSVKHDEESCTMNGVAVDCATMHAHDTPPVQQHQDVSFACDNTTCQSGSQYCLRDVSSRTGQTLSSGCAPAPSSCTGCDCFEQNAKDLAGGLSSSCGMVSCQQNDSQFQVTCYSH